MTTLNHLENIKSYNDQALQELAWAIEASSKEFSLTLAHCNYMRLREQLIERLQNLCPVEIQTISLKSSTTRLYTAIQEALQEKTPSALMVLGLESISNLPEALSSANKVREEFRKNFPFPVVIWVNDRVLEQLIQWAPDFKSWATTTEFAASTEALLQGMQEETNELFFRLLNPRTQEPISNREVHYWEAHTALHDLNRQGQDLEPALKSSVDFVMGREADTAARQEFEAAQQVSANRHMEAARQYYQQSLAYWQQVNNLERQGILLYHLGRNYCRQAEYYATKRRLQDPYNRKELSSCYEKAKHYLHQCIITFLQAHRPDLVADFITELGEVLEHQENWDALQKLTEKALVLHQTYEDFEKLARDYSFLANIALHQSRWQDAYHRAQQVMDIIHTKVPDSSELHQIGLFLLAQAQEQLGQFSEASASLEEAWTIAEQNQEFGAANPQIVLHVLELLHKLYFQQRHYLEAFRVKHAQYSIEQQYGLRAFIGPGRLKSQRQVLFTTPETGQPATVAQEILVSGRQQKVQELINRVKEYRYNLTVLYGQSGVGKSSVIEAGLIPALKQETVRGLMVVPVLQRNYTHWAKELGTCLCESLREVGALCNAEVDSPQAILDQLKRNEQRHLLTVLIFDQFEEFFFICRDPAEHQRFADFLCQCLNLGEVKIILSLREDYLHRLLQYSHNIKQVNVQNEILTNILNQDNLCYIDNLASEETKALIQTLTQRSQAYQPELVEALVKDLAADTGDVRPIELQIVGFQLEEEHITTLPQYTGRRAMVQRYLDDVVADCGEENQRAAELVLYLLTDENNTRPIKTQAQLETDLKSIAQDLKSIAQDLLQEADKLHLVLQIFVEAGIVQLMHESPADRYQLVHDYLVTIIRHENETKLPQLKLELEKEKAQRQYAEKQRDQAWQDLHKQNHELKTLNGTLAKQKTSLEKFRQNLVAAAVALVVVTGVAGVFALQFRRNEAIVTASRAEALLESNQELDALEVSLQALQRSKNIAWLDPMFRWFHREDMQSQIKRTLQESFYAVREVNRLESHLGAVRAISFSPDGEMIATASDDNTAIIWNQNGKVIKTLGKRQGQQEEQGQTQQEHNGPIYSVSFSPNGDFLATASGDGTVKLWCKDCYWTCPYTLKGHQGEVYSVSYSPDGQILASAGEDKTVKLWREDGQFIRTLAGHQASVRSVTFSPDGQTIASASDDGTVRLWNRDGQPLKTLTGHQKAVYSVTFSPDGKTIATASADKTAKLWNQDGQLLQTLIGHQDPVRSVSFSRDGQTIVTAGDDTTVKLWSLDGQLLQTLRGHEEPIYQVSFSPNSVIATASADTTVKLWKLNPYLQEHNGRITAVSFSPVDQRIVTAAEDNTVKLWNRDGQYLRSLGEHQLPVRTISFSPYGEIATAGEDNTVKLWTQNGQLFRILAGHQAPVRSISFSPDGQLIVTASGDTTANGDNSVKLWNQKGNVLTTLPHNQPLDSVSFSDDGQKLITIGEDHTVQVLDVSEVLDGKEGILPTFTGKELRTLNNKDIDFVKVSPDGQILAIVNRMDREVALWNIKDRKNIEDIKNKGSVSLLHEKPLEDLSFSPDSKWVATASKDKIVTLWTLQGTEQAQFTWHYRGSVEHLTFSPDSDTIALSSTSGRIILWHWRQKIDELKDISCRQVNDYLQHSLNSTNAQLCDETQIENQ